jgi:hypothetical protein
MGSLARPHDAPRRNTGKFFGTLEFGDERVSIRAARAAHQAPVELVARTASGILPGLVIGPSTEKNPLSWSATIRKKDAAASDAGTFQ